MLLADFRTVFFGEIFVAEGTMKIHPRPQHMRVDDKDFFTIWTSDFYGLTHGLPLSLFWILDFRFWIGGSEQLGNPRSVTQFPFASYAFFAAILRSP
jgi:hypothetical protein